MRRSTAKYPWRTLFLQKGYRSVSFYMRRIEPRQHLRVCTGNKSKRPKIGRWGTLRSPSPASDLPRAGVRLGPKVMPGFPDAMVFYMCGPCRLPFHTTCGSCSFLFVFVEMTFRRIWFHSHELGRQIDPSVYVGTYSTMSDPSFYAFTPGFLLFCCFLPSVCVLPGSSHSSITSSNFLASAFVFHSVPVSQRFGMSILAVSTCPDARQQTTARKVNTNSDEERDCWYQNV